MAAPKKSNTLNTFSGYPPTVISEWCAVSLRTARAYKAGTRAPSPPALKLFALHSGGRVFGPTWTGWLVKPNSLVDPEGNETTRIQLHNYFWVMQLARQLAGEHSPTARREFYKLLSPTPCTPLAEKTLAKAGGADGSLAKPMGSLAPTPERGTGGPGTARPKKIQGRIERRASAPSYRAPVAPSAVVPIVAVAPSPNERTYGDAPRSPRSGRTRRTRRPLGVVARPRSSWGLSHSTQGTQDDAIRGEIRTSRTSLTAPPITPLDTPS
jgi:hypothetical protein